VNDAAGRAATLTEQSRSGRPPWEPEPPPVPQPPAGLPLTDGARPATAGQPSRAAVAAGSPGPAPALRRRRGGRRAVLPYLAVLAVMGAGLWWTSQSAQQVRGGTVAVAGALFVAALARLVLPEEWAGLLASRKRFIDVVTLVALASGLLAAGLVLPTPS
jgi:hypothetical protein